MKRPADFEKSAEYFHHLFASSKRLSYAAYSKRLGYSSPRLLEMVCQGKRLASEDFIFRVQKYAGLSEEDFLVLCLLVKRDRLKSQNKDHGDLDRNLAIYRRKFGAPEKVEVELFNLISEWHYLVLRQMFKSGVKLDYNEIYDRLKRKVPIPELKKTVHTLKNLGFIDIDNTGQIQNLKPHGIYTHYDAPSRAIRSHHNQMMDRAKEALEETPMDDREMVSLTFTCNPKNMRKLKEEIRNFRNRMDFLYSDDNSSSVFQINIQFFEHTKSS